MKKLSWEEMQKRREKGLCFGCNKKFTLGHRCQTPQAFVIEVVTTEVTDNFQRCWSKNDGREEWV
jgi:hypothetical protein